MRRAIGIGLIPAMILATTSAHATDIVDYRDHSFLVGSPFYSQVDRQKISDALKKAPGDPSGQMGNDFAILGDADGAYTARDANERIYLIQSAAPAAIDPFPQGVEPVLLVTNGGAFVQSYRLPKDIQYQRLIAAADSDGDGIDEVLLEMSFMNMGQLVTSVNVIGLKDGKASVKQALQEVYSDSCENEGGEKKRVASTISIADKLFKAEPHDVDCD